MKMMKYFATDDIVVVDHLLSGQSDIENEWTAICFVQAFVMIAALIVLGDHLTFLLQLLAC